MATIITIPKSFIQIVSENLLKSPNEELTIIAAAIPPSYRKHPDNLICKLRTRKGLENITYSRSDSGDYFVFKMQQPITQP